MVPLRLRLRGFLSYRDEQEICFEGASLWMLAGPNGSGKSSIFDAITYALFGAHRGGLQNAEELIHKDASSLEVDFVFRVQKRQYQIRRTLKRTSSSGGKARLSSTRQAWERDAAGNWQAIPETEREEGFKNWVRSLLGFDYHTFTSSVLLLQGQAEKLLNNDATHRFQVLSHIVDLERYEELFRKADEKRRNAKVAYEAAWQRSAALPVVTEEQWQQACQRVTQAQNEIQACDLRLDQLHEGHKHSQRWLDLRQQLLQLQRQLQHVQELCRQRETLERDYTRWKELRDALPVVEEILTAHGRLQDSQQKVEQLRKKLDGQREELNRCQSEQIRCDKELTVHKQKLAEEQQECDKLHRQLREIGPQLVLCQQWEQLQQEIQELEKKLQGLPADLEAQYQQVKGEIARLQQAEQDYHHLERLHQKQAACRQMQAQERHKRQEEEQLREQGALARQAAEQAQQQLEQAQQRQTRAQDHWARQQALLQQAQQELQAFRSLEGEKVCRACGQPLTPAHYAAEEQRRTQQLAQLEAAVRAAQVELQKATLHLDECRRAELQARERLDQLREQYRDTQTALRHLQEKLQQTTQECKEAYFRLSPAARQRFGSAPPNDWTAIDYPSREELLRWKKEVEQLPQLQQHCQGLERQMQELRQWRDRLTTARQRSEQLRHDLPPQPLTAAQLHHRRQLAEGQLHTLQQSVASRQNIIQQLENKRRALQDRVQHLDRECLNLELQIKYEQDDQRKVAETIERERKRLSAPWQQAVDKAGLSQRQAWKQELEQLEQRGIETLYQQLRLALEQRHELEQRYQILQQQEQSFPPEVRQPPEWWQEQIEQHKQRRQKLTEDLTHAISQRDALKKHKEEREQLQRTIQELNLQHSRWKKLCDLLGRQGLQLHLLRKSERQIVSYADQILDRISGGQLALRCVTSDEGTVSEKALELECLNRQSGRQAINIKFLSGSQKFRVAVALALAIGKYVSHRHQPIECVIIDEGFGCLDREGRHVMIQELLNLSSCLQCILLVSHQEEFADAFRNGYRFELRQGSTCVERLQR